MILLNIRNLKKLGKIFTKIKLSSGFPSLNLEIKIKKTNLLVDTMKRKSMLVLEEA